MPARRNVNLFYNRVSNFGVCVYCGEPANTWDHFVPVSFANAIYDVATLGGGNVLLPSCSECNSLASDYVFKTVGAKRRYIQKRIARKYKKLLAGADWPETELAKMGWWMQRFIRASMARKQIILWRIQWRNSRNFASAAIARISMRLDDTGKGSAVKYADGNSKQAKGGVH